MRKIAHLCLCIIATVIVTVCASRPGWSAERRFALVIGNDAYKPAPLPTPSNDAGLVADALQSAGFAVSGARNLDQDTLRRSFREFLDRVASAGPDAVALVYFAGLGLQFEGDNYFVPVDADLKRDVDIPIQAIRISDFVRSLAALPGRVKIVILDSARQNPFSTAGQPIASGLALVDPDPGSAIAFNTAPGTIGPPEKGPYGAFATALAEMIQTGGFGLDELFARVRLRVDEITQGAEVPWFASQIAEPFEFTVRDAGAPPLPAAVSFADVRRKPLRSYSVETAYAAALERDSIEGYEEFLAAFPDSPFARRIDLMLAARREAMIWRRCVREDSPPAYWSYMRRYPDGPHVFDAQRRLRYLVAAAEPLAGFAPLDFGVAPPSSRELGYFNRRVLLFGGPDNGPPPPPPAAFLPPRPREGVNLPPPPPPSAAFVLPTSAAAVLPLHVRPPAIVAPLPADTERSGTPRVRARIPVSLPPAVEGKGNPAAVKSAPLPGPPRPGDPGNAAIKPTPPVAPTRPGAPVDTAIKPGPTPLHPAPTVPALAKPAPVVPPQAAPPAAAAIKPAPVPPPPAPVAPTVAKPAPIVPPQVSPPAAAAVKPAPVPPHPVPVTPTVVKPAPVVPPQVAAPGPAAVRPGAPTPPARIVCPAGKRAAVENGHEVCK
jgi:uncharacterized caspase-like protein